jgi:23S rRNA (uracil1939-C5)-methyltransferase
LSSETTKLRVTSLAAGGDGLGRLDDGRVVFVEGGVPGDLVELVDLRLGKRMANARVGRVLEASPDRIQPRCPHFGTCGGCAWQQIRYAAQLEAKRMIVRDALERIGGLSLGSEVEILESPDPYNYRARARLVETTTGVGYRKRGSRETIAVDQCPILVPTAQAKLRELIDRSRDPSEANAAPASTSKRRKQPEWEILAGSTGDAEAHRVGTRSGIRRTIEIEVLGESLEASLGSFVQGNSLLWDALASEVRTQCLSKGEAGASGQAQSFDVAPRFVELFAGIGFLTLPLARAGCRGVVFESGRDALEDLAKNLDRAGFASEIEIVRGRVERQGNWAARFAEADLLLLDPPRTGLDSNLRRAIGESGPQRIVYVSCDPATLARDLRDMVAAGYRLVHLKAIDLFPQTSHVEVVVRLERDVEASDPIPATPSAE